MNKSRSATAEEIKELADAFGSIPESLVQTLKSDVISRNFNLSEDEDASGFGVAMEWMEPKEQLEEALEYYPGIAAIRKHYIPIGKCMNGSGDPYFVKEDSGILKIYRIPHDAVSDDDMLDQAQVEFVCELEFLLKKYNVPYSSF